MEPLFVVNILYELPEIQITQVHDDDQYDFRRVIIYETGDVEVTGGNTVDNWVSLDGITFRASGY